MSDLQPTVVLPESKGRTPTSYSSADVSRARVGVVEGSGPRLADETRDLLRARLKAASLVVAIALSLGLIEKVCRAAVLAVIMDGVLIVLMAAWWEMQVAVEP
jgi:hypothetical protein